GAAREGARLCRRGCRYRAPPPQGAEAAPPLGAAARLLRDGGAAAGFHRRRYGARRHPRRSRRAQPPIAGFRRAPRRARAGDPQARGPSLQQQLAAVHDLPARVLDWRQLAKLKSTYADALIEEINPTTGRVHTCFSLSGAITGRLSSTEPNLQNIPIRTEEG